MPSVREAAEALKGNIGRVIVGKGEVIELVLVALLCEGHILIEDVPGIGKTTLAKAVARSLGLSFRRIQFTPDLLPSDIIGINYYNQKTSAFEFRPGPILSQIVLADEINRATPRTQSALLESMEERQVTVDGATIPLARPFLVMATQNPIELEGTFPLPEAQLDRFLLRLRLGYPSEEEEQAIVVRFEGGNPLEELGPVLSGEELLALQRECLRMHLEPALRQYAVELVRATRTHPGIELGASPRGSLALSRTAQALAAIRGRAYVLPDDVKYLASFVLPHRLILSPQAKLRGQTSQRLLDEILHAVPIPI